MPEWFSVQNVSTYFLAVFFCVVIWGIVRIAKFFAPLIRRRFEKLTLKHEADAALSDSLVLTTARQTALMEGQTAILNDHGRTLGLHGQTLETHGEQLRSIARRVGAEVHLPARTHIVPSLEVTESGVSPALTVIREEDGPSNPTRKP